MGTSPAQTPSLLLDVEVDGRVEFHARSLLPLCGQHEQERRGGSTSGEGARSTVTTMTPQLLPVVAGAEGWLPALVDAGRQEVWNCMGLLYFAEDTVGRAAYGNDTPRDCQTVTRIIYSKARDCQ